MDWQRVVNEILAAGETQTGLALDIGSSQTYISEIANGRISEPSWSRGQKLLRIYRDTFPGIADPESWGA